MSSLRLGLSLCLALVGVVASAGPLRAESAAHDEGQSTDRGAQIVLVGAAGRDPELEALLAELLERRGVRTRISEQDGFSADQLLHRDGRSDGVFVFVVPGAGGNVRLYFRAPDGERFLRRSLLLRAGFDDVGRELVGQVVETAVGSLLDSGDGLTREQAQLALTNDEAVTTSPDTAEAATLVAQPSPTVAPSAPPRHEDSPPSTVGEGWLALRYGAVGLGPALGVAHGPGAECGFGLRRGYLLRGRLMFERDFPQTFSTSQIAAELSRTRLRVALDTGVELTRRQALLASLGLGQDRVAVTPTAPPGSSVAPAASFRDRAPVLLAELRYEAALGNFRVAGALGGDISLVHTHYDIAHSEEHESVAQVWQVRPSASLTLAFSPHLAEF